MIEQEVLDLFLNACSLCFNHREIIVYLVLEKTTKYDCLEHFF